MSKRILVVYYSQTGEVRRAIDAFVTPFSDSGAVVDIVQLEPQPPYPYPWKFGAFLRIFPDCLNGDAPEVNAPGLSIETDYDLIVLGYQVWFLSPSLPIQGFLQSKSSAILQGRPLITLTVCRNMWHNGFLKLRRMLEAKGAHLVDNIVVTHQGPAWSTFITTVRSLLTGKKNEMLGLPSASVDQRRIDEVKAMGGVVAEHLNSSSPMPGESMLKGHGAVHIDRNYLVPEIIAGRAFLAWARAAKAIGRRSTLGRTLFLYLFIFTLAIGIVTVIPLTMLGLKLFGARWQSRLNARIALLESPSGN